MYYNSGSIFESINNTTGRQFALINQTRLNNDAKPELPLNTMDTLIADKAEGGCAGLADFALMQQKVGNYQKALRALDEMKACGDDFDVFGLNAGSIRALLAELSLSDEPYVIDVMIAPRKQSLSKPGTFELPDYNAALNDFQRLVRKQPDNAYALLQYGYPETDDETISPVNLMITARQSDLLPIWLRLITTAL